MASKFSSSFDDLLANGKRQLDELSRDTVVPAPVRAERPKAASVPVATPTGKTSVIKGKAGGIDFRLTTRSE